MKQKVNVPFADTLPRTFKRACGVMSGDGGFKEWLDARFGDGKWAICAFPRGDVEIALSHDGYYDLAVEYGYQRLSAIFASLDPVSAASHPPANRGGAS